MTALKKKPGLAQMLRAPFFSSILAPLIVGTLTAAAVNDSFSVPGFLLVLVIGLGLHAAVNVYNDIYDTIQGTDKVNVHRNEFSGGSGVLVDHPGLMPKMYNLARAGLLVALAGTAGLFFFIGQPLYPYLAGLYLLAAFFTKYYTAAPVKLAYRGFGEISTWFAFGPMAVFIAAVSQNVGLEPAIIYIMPATGLSTLSILWLGQMIDLPADKAGGKFGLVARIGTRSSAWGLLVIHTLLAANIIVLPFISPVFDVRVIGATIPSFYLGWKIMKIVFAHHDEPDELKAAAKINVTHHLLFSLFLAIALALPLLGL